MRFKLVPRYDKYVTVSNNIITKENTTTLWPLYNVLEKREIAAVDYIEKLSLLQL